MPILISTILGIVAGYFAKETAAFVDPGLHYIALNCVGAFVFAPTMLASLVVMSRQAMRREF
jgi:sugar phosphate permease